MCELGQAGDHRLFGCCIDPEGVCVATLFARAIRIFDRNLGLANAAEPLDGLGLRQCGSTGGGRIVSPCRSQLLIEPVEQVVASRKMRVAPMRHIPDPRWSCLARV